MIRFADEDFESTVDAAESIASRAVREAIDVVHSMGRSLLDLFRRLLSFDSRLFSSAATIVDDSARQIGGILYDAQLAAYLDSGFRAARPIVDDLAKETLAERPSLFLPRRGGVELPPIDRSPRSLLYPSEPPRIEFPIVDKAAEKLASVEIMRPEDFYALSARAREDAFTVSGDLADKTIEKIADVLDETFRESGSREDFMRRVADELPTLPLGEARVEQVFRNNVNGAYSDGGEAMLSNPLVEDAFPFRAYYAIRDQRVRETHLQLEKMGLSGTNVYHKDDPVWQTFRPPWEWNCRCGWAPFSLRQAARNGVAEAKEWIETGTPPANLFVQFPDFAPPPSWRRLE